MKRTIALLAAVAVSILSISASAQDKQIFNHAALGITAGLDGVGAEAVMPITPFLQLRGGYSFLPYTYKGVYNSTVKDYSGPVPVTADIWKGGLGKAMLDIYPGRETGFHFVAGAFFGSGKLVSITADGRNVLSPEDYGVGVGWRGVSISTDADGFAHADAMVPNVLPYFGLGFGRSVDPDKRVSFTFELGAAYTGGVKLTLYDYSNPLEVTTGVITSDVLVDDAGKQLDQGWVDKICGFPVFPMLKMGLFVRIF